MIRTGDIIENPVTGERVRFLVASIDTNGAYSKVEYTVPPTGVGARAHVHPHQTETFEVVDGTLEFEVNGEVVTATAGDIVAVEPGQAHKYWNDGDDDAVFRCEVRPALGFDQLLETMFALAADGKTNRPGMPNPLRLAVIARSHIDDVRLPVPLGLQRFGLALGAPLGRACGFGATYEPAPATRPLVPADA